MLSKDPGDPDHKMTVSLLFIGLLIVQACHGRKPAPGQSGFIVGRLPSSGWDYSRMNGVWYPNRAAQACEEDPECSGFTYQGAKGVNQPFDIRFFRHIAPESFEASRKERQWTWTSYRCSRKFWATFQSGPATVQQQVPSDSVLSRTDKLWAALTSGKSIKKWPFNHHEAVLFPAVHPHDARLIPGLNASFNEGLLSTSDPLSRFVLLMSRDVSLPDRADTTAAPEPLLMRSCQRRLPSPAVQPLLLTHCLDQCPALPWTLPDVIRRFPDATWKVLRSTGPLSRAKPADLTQLRSGESKVVQAQCALDVKDASSSSLLSSLSSSDSLGPPGVDLLNLLPIRMGPSLMLDFFLADHESQLQYSVKGFGQLATVFRGQQLWSLFPTVDQKHMARLNFSRNSWPQLSKLSFYGQQPVQHLLKPDQVLFIPPGWCYAVESLNGTVALTRQQFLPQGLELALQGLTQSELQPLKKALQEDDLMRPLWTRFREAMNLRRGLHKYS